MSEAPRDDINRIIIGLGGQGSRVVNEVRKSVEAQGAIPPGLAFIAVDSDRVALSNLDSVPDAQRIHLAAPDDTITETVVPWLPHEFRPKAGGGCGMQRLTGKAMYLVHKHRILEVVRDVARQLRSRTQVNDVMVVIVNAFGGGTGSGMLIDFALDVRGDIKEVTGQDPLMFGIGVLPSRAETIQRANGIALIKELHFLLSRKEPVVIGGRDHANPFELYFLVGREVMGIERDEEILQSIVRFALDLGLIPSASREHAAAGKGAGFVDLQDIRTLVKGASHMFSTFGHYRALFPQKDLIAYFAALDEAAKLRAELPTLVTDVEAFRQKLEEKRIALAHDEQTLARARERAARLRADGVMGANRPELAKLLADIGRLDDSTRKARHEIARDERAASTHAGRRAEIEERLRALDVLLAEIHARLISPVQTRTTFTVPLTAPEIERLASERHLVTDGHFLDVMRALGRLPDYHDKTMEVVGKNKVLYMPLLNYRMAFHTAAAFPPPVLDALRKHGFVRFDDAGNPIVSDEHLWMVMAMLATDVENIDATKVAGRAFKELVEGHVARRAEVKITPSVGKPYEVVVHSWMVGIQVAPLAPGYPPRLKELEWLGPEYEQVKREGGLAQHHAFLYGDPAAFSRLSGIPVDRASVARTNELVTEFWGSYQPIDAPARWLQMPPLLAEAHARADALAKAVTGLADEVDRVRSEDPDASTIDRASTALVQGLEAIDAFQRAFIEDAHPLRARLADTLHQLERTTVPPRDPEKLLAMEELAAEASDAVADAAAAIEALRATLPESMRATIAAAQGVAASSSQPGRRAGAVRFAHQVAQAEGRAAKVHDATADTLRHLDELARLVERVESMLRERALAPVGGKLRAPGAAAGVPPKPSVGHGFHASAPMPVTPPSDHGHHGNGHAHLHPEDLE